MKRISIGSWAYTIGPYQDKPVPWGEVLTNLKEMDFDGVELGGFPPHPNPDGANSAKTNWRCSPGPINWWTKT